MHVYYLLTRKTRLHAQASPVRKMKSTYIQLTIGMEVKTTLELTQVASPCTFYFNFFVNSTSYINCFNKMQTFYNNFKLKFEKAPHTSGLTRQIPGFVYMNG